MGFRPKRSQEFNIPAVQFASFPGCAILAPCQEVGPGRDENGGGAGLITVCQVPATAARESNR